MQVGLAGNMNSRCTPHQSSDAFNIGNERYLTMYYQAIGMPKKLIRLVAQLPCCTQVFAMLASFAWRAFGLFVFAATVINNNGKALSKIICPS